MKKLFNTLMIILIVLFGLVWTSFAYAFVFALYNEGSFADWTKSLSGTVKLFSIVYLLFLLLSLLIFLLVKHKRNYIESNELSERKKLIESFYLKVIHLVALMGFIYIALVNKFADHIHVDNNFNFGNTYFIYFGIFYLMLGFTITLNYLFTNSNNRELMLITKINKVLATILENTTNTFEKTIESKSFKKATIIIGAVFATLYVITNVLVGVVAYNLIINHQISHGKHDIQFILAWIFLVITVIGVIGIIAVSFKIRKKFLSMLINEENKEKGFVQFINYLPLTIIMLLIVSTYIISVNIYRVL